MQSYRVQLDWSMYKSSTADLRGLQFSLFCHVALVPNTGGAVLQGCPLPACLVMEKGEPLESWLSEPENALDTIGSLQARPPFLLPLPCVPPFLTPFTCKRHSSYSWVTTWSAASGCLYTLSLIHISEPTRPY